MVSRKAAKLDRHDQPPASPPPPMKVTVDGDILKRLYARMLKCRMTIERAHGLLSNEEAAPGKEAAIAGATVDLLPDDAVAPASDRAAVHLALGTPLAQVLPRKNGSHSDPPDSPAGLHVLPTRAAASSQLGFAVGVALAFQMQGGHHVVAALTDAAALNFGSSHEALTFASVHRMPIVFVVECGAAAPDFMVKAEAYGIPGIAVEGADAVAVYRVSREAINRARSGRGPSLIECRTFDAGMDPIAHMEKYLEKHGWWTADWKRQLTHEYKREIDDAVRAARPS